MKTALLTAALLALTPIAHADEEPLSASITKCLEAWGNAPFGKHPKYKTMSTSVKVFGIGKNPIDDDVTSKPALVLVNAAVNVMGGTTIQLLNPQGWYCFRSNVNVMGGLKIKAACHAHLASAHDGTTVMGKGDNSVTVMGSTKVELVGCKGGESTGEDASD